MRGTLPPGPRIPSLIQGVGFWTRPISTLERYRARYGKRFTMRLPGAPPFVILTEPDQIKEVYTAPPDVLMPGVGARVLLPLVGHNSVILLDRDEHMEQRKLILPAFHGERMERLSDLVGEVTVAELDRWQPEETSLHPRFQALTLEIILRAVFGLDEGPRLDGLRRSLNALLQYGDNPLTLLQPPQDPDELERSIQRFNRFGPLKGFADRRDEVNQLLADQIAERRAEGDEGRDDVLAMLLAARHEDDGSEMSAQELRDELMTLLVAGHETTASSLAWCFSRLAREPRVLAELTAAVEDDDDSPYLTATIQETLRARPVLMNTAPRYVEKPITVGGWDYEPGCALTANAYLLHHDPDIYPDPYAFRPERFVDEKPGTYTWIPFGGGRRRCIGSSFAMLEMKIVVAEMVRRFDVRAAKDGPEVAKRRNITIYPGQSARVKLGARGREAVAA